ncbi:hypothetical protein FOXYSP1_07692 [Fusarium oxysporum f. sp. phaseoli]
MLVIFVANCHIAVIDKQSHQLSDYGDMRTRYYRCPPPRDMHQDDAR